MAERVGAGEQPLRHRRPWRRHRGLVAQCLRGAQPDNPNSWCDGWSGFCNATAGSDSASPNAKIPADYLSLTNVGCAPAAGNTNPSPLAGSGGNFPVGQGAVALCTAAAGSSAGSFKVDATFSLQVPPWVYAGQYEATVVFLVM